MRLIPIAALLLAAGLGAAVAQETSVAPTINQNFKSADLDVEGWATRFTGESREAFNARHAASGPAAL